MGTEGSQEGQRNQALPQSLPAHPGQRGYCPASKCALAFGRRAPAPEPRACSARGPKGGVGAGVAWGRRAPEEGQKP